MKLYDFTLAPNPRRVRMFLVEKGIEIPTVQVDIRDREQFGADFLAISPHSVLPVLELDDGSRIGESVAICRYIEETHPEPPLMGRDSKEKAVIEMWNRRAEFEGFGAAAEAVRNSLPLFEDRGAPGVPGGVPQIPALIDRGKQSMGRFYDKLDKQLGENRYVAGDAFSIADITAFVGIEFGKRADIEMPDSCPNVARWHDGMAARPSASA